VCNVDMCVTWDRVQGQRLSIPLLQQQQQQPVIRLRGIQLTCIQSTRQHWLFVEMMAIALIAVHVSSNFTSSAAPYFSF
jgi:hypothetical protein